MNAALENWQSVFGLARSDQRGPCPPTHHHRPLSSRSPPPKSLCGSSRAFSTAEVSGIQRSPVASLVTLLHLSLASGVKTRHLLRPNSTTILGRKTLDFLYIPDKTISAHKLGITVASHEEGEPVSDQTCGPSRPFIPHTSPVLSGRNPTVGR